MWPAPTEAESTRMLAGIGGPSDGCEDTARAEGNHPGAEKKLVTPTTPTGDERYDTGSDSSRIVSAFCAALAGRMTSAWDRMPTRQPVSSTTGSRRSWWRCISAMASETGTLLRMVWISSDMN